jgi:chromosomal replication initiator protein
MDKFKKKYRECDILIIDDIQFLSGKNATQEEFFHTFNDLHNANKQIVLAADKTPKQIVGLEDRLKSRFEWGLQADIQATELETKIAIIQKKCQLDKVSLGQDIINYIATTISTNTREIEGMLTRLHAQASMMNTEITLDFTKDVLKEQIQEEKEEISINNIIALISKELNVKPSEIKSKNRSRNVVQARRIAIYLARTLTPNSMPQLASYFGMKDHSAVSYAMKTINKLLNENENFKLKVIELKNKIYN